MPNKLTLEPFQQIAIERGGKCLSKEYINSRTKMKWKCKYSHVWEARPIPIRQGHWCPFCNKTMKLTLDDMHKLAKRYGGKCLSKKYVNSVTKMIWECSNDHKWNSTPHDIKTGYWCPICTNRRKSKLDIKEMQEIAKSHGGKCLSKKYKDNQTKLKWQCSEGHIWKSMPITVKQGNWCSECARKNQKIDFDVVKKMVRDKGGVCLTNDYLNQKKDIKIKCKKGHVFFSTAPNIKSGHWCPVCSREESRLPSNVMHEVAKEKWGKCLSKEYKNSKTKLKWKCKRGHIWYATLGSVKGNDDKGIRGSWCPICAREHPRRYGKATLKDMRELASDKGGRCLSRWYKGATEKLEWECKQDHLFKMAPVHVRRGSWCPACAGVKKLTIKEMRKIAKKQGGWCLSEEYVNCVTKLKWMCKYGHTWKAIPLSVKRGHWCPICAKKSKLTIQELQNLARQKGGRCLSKKYSDPDKKLLWECKEGHKWKALPVTIKRGHWCYICGKKESGQKRKGMKYRKRK